VTTLLITCELAADARGRMKPSFMLLPGASWVSVEVLGDPNESGRVTVRVETADPDAILACEGVELVEG
jgi:hypothetical protein